LYVKSLLTGYSECTVATRRIVLVWTTKHPDHLEWIKPWTDEISAINGSIQVLEAKMFISRPLGCGDVYISSSIFELIRGRPDLDTLIAREQEHQTGAMAVSVCGPGELGDGVRYIVRKLQRWSTIDLLEEAFSW
jgi:hypothetical protein